MEKEEIYEHEDLKQAELTTFVHDFYEKVNEYNATHETKASVLVIAVEDKDKGVDADFIVGDTWRIASEMVCATKWHKGFKELCEDFCKIILEAFRSK